MTIENATSIVNILEDIGGLIMFLILVYSVNQSNKQANEA